MKKAICGLVILCQLASMLCGCDTGALRWVSRWAASCTKTSRNRLGLRSPLTDISWYGCLG